MVPKVQTKSGSGFLTKTAPSFCNLHFKDFKALDQPGRFSGHLAVFNNIDLGLDCILPGAFKKTLADAETRRGKEGGPYLFPILWQHNPTEPIGGFLVMQEDAVGLYVEGELDLDIPEGKRAYSGLKKGYLKGLSIGYDTILESWEKNVRYLKEIRLWEGSVVTFPMNPQAGVDAVKDVVAQTSQPVRVVKRDMPVDVWICPHCEQEIGEKEFYSPDSKTTIHSTCKGVITLPPGEPSWLDDLPGQKGKTEGEEVKNKRRKDMGEGAEPEDILKQCMTLMAQCQGMMPKALGDQATVNAVMACMGQCMALMSQCMAAMESAEPEAQPITDLSFEDRIERVWQAVRMIERIPYSDGVGTHARYYLQKTWETYCVAEDDTTGKYVKIPWTMGANGIELGELTEVVMTWTPAQKAAWDARKAEMKAAEHTEAKGSEPPAAKAGARNNANDATTIRDIHKAAASLMEKPHRCKCYAEDITEMPDDDLTTVFSLLDDNVKAKVSVACQPGSGPVKSHPQTPTDDSGNPGPADSHPEAPNLAAKRRARELELLEMESRLHQ